MTYHLFVSPSPTFTDLDIVFSLRGNKVSFVVKFDKDKPFSLHTFKLSELQQSINQVLDKVLVNYYTDYEQFIVSKFDDYDLHPLNVTREQIKSTIVTMLKNREREIHYGGIDHANKFSYSFGYKITA